MTYTNPPQERATTHSLDETQRNRHRLRQLADIAAELFRRHEVMRQFGLEIQHAQEAESEADSIYVSAGSFLNEHEPDPNHRANLWLTGRWWTQEPDDYLDPREGARDLNNWFRGIYLGAARR